MSNAIAVNPFKVGDVLFYDSGWNRSIPNFVQVTRVTAKNVFGRFLKTRSVMDDGYGQNGDCVPRLQEFDSEEQRIGKVVVDRYGASVQTPGYYHHYAQVWDGNPKSYTTD